MDKLLTPLFRPVLPDSAMGNLLAFWQIELEAYNVEERMRWIFDTFDSQVAFAPSWSEEDLVIGSLLEKWPAPVPVVDHLHHLLLPETWVPLPPEDATDRTFDGRGASVGLWARFHVEQSCKRHEKTINRYRAWIVSIRREQEASFEKMPVLSWNERFGIVRIAPLACWTREHVDRFCATTFFESWSGTKAGTSERSRGSMVS